MHAPFEIAVAAQHGGGHQVGLAQGRFHLRVHGSAVADAGGAAVRHHVEAQLLQVLQQAGLFRYAVTTREPGARLVLIVGATWRPRSTAFLGQQAGRQQHVRVRGVGAAGDGRQHDRAVLQAALAGHAGLFAQLVGRQAVSALLHGRGQGLLEGGFDVPEGQAVLRALRAGDARLELREVELQHLRELGLRRVRGAEEALRLAVALDQLNLLAGRPVSRR
jgi:hypothetical protein